MSFFYLIKPDTSYDFIGKFRYVIFISIVAFAFLFYALFREGVNYGIDFTGGTVIQIKFAQAQPPAGVRQLLLEVNAEGASAVSLGKGNLEYLITARTVVAKDQKPLTERLLEKIGRDNMEILKVDIVGPKVGKELKAAAMRSLFYSLLFIMIYIWFRFDLRFAPGATLALIHDILIVTGFYIISGREFTISSVAALLTVAGYSVNDTIVVYDRVRELIKKAGGDIELTGVLNRAINLTLSRTIITSLLTLFAVIALVFFTKGEIQTFALAMCVGVIVGTYSTIFIACPFTIYTQKLLAKKQGAR